MISVTVNHSTGILFDTYEVPLPPVSNPPEVAPRLLPDSVDLIETVKCLCSKISNRKILCVSQSEIYIFITPVNFHYHKLSSLVS